MNDPGAAVPLGTLLETAGLSGGGRVRLLGLSLGVECVGTREDLAALLGDSAADLRDAGRVGDACARLTDLCRIKDWHYEELASEGGRPFDLNLRPLPFHLRNAFDVVLNANATGRALNLINAFAIAHDAAKAGGVLVHLLAAGPGLRGGFHLAEQALVEAVAEANGYRLAKPVRRIAASGVATGPAQEAAWSEGYWEAVFVKTTDAPFAVPSTFAPRTTSAGARTNSGDARPVSKILEEALARRKRLPGAPLPLDEALAQFERASVERDGMRAERDRMTAERDEARVQADRIEREAALRIAYAESETDLHRTRMQAEIDARVKERDDAVTERDEARTQRDIARAELAFARAELAFARTHYEDIRRSTSWRSTAWLRRLSNAILGQKDRRRR